MSQIEPQAPLLVVPYIKFSRLGSLYCIVLWDIFPYKRHRDTSSGIVIASLYNIIVMLPIKQDIEADHNREQQKYLSELSKKYRTGTTRHGACGSIWLILKFHISRTAYRTEPVLCSFYAQCAVSIKYFIWYIALKPNLMA